MAIDNILLKTRRGSPADSREHQPPSEHPAAKSARWQPEALSRWRDARLALMSYEIHDGLAQHLAGAQMRLETLLDADHTLSAQARRELQVSLALVRKSACEARHLMRGLLPPTADDPNVVAAVERMIRELPPGGPSMELLHEGHWEDLDALVETSVFRIIQEAVSNATRHSRSRRVVVRMTRDDARIELEVRDWGIGFDPAHASPDRCGLHGLSERARHLGGRTKITSSPGEGTRVFVELPIAGPLGRQAQELQDGSDQ